MIKAGMHMLTRIGQMERECVIRGEHDKHDFRGRWYVDILHDDGRSLGVFIRNEEELLPLPQTQVAG